MTFVAFPNIEATSPSGIYRVEIVGSPEEHYFRDQKDFVYQLYSSNRLVWEWPASQAESVPEFLDDYPHEAWVSDDGWVVVRTHEWFHAGILVLSPDGRVVLRRLHQHVVTGDGPGFLDGEPSEYMGDGSAGPFWATSAMGYFANYEGQDYWIIRTWWGRRVVIDLTNAQFLDASAINDDIARSHEIGWIQRALSADIVRIEAKIESDEEDDDGSWWRLTKRVLTAAYHAGWLRAVDAAPYLRRLEVVSHVGQSSPRGWARYHALTFRQVAKLSLLRMGLEPQWISHYEFDINPDFEGPLDPKRQLFPCPIQVCNRDLEMLKPGLTIWETLGRIGAPDFIDKEWDYDFMSGTQRQTARVHWDDSHLRGLTLDAFRQMVRDRPARIARVEILDPQWELITMRDRYIVG